MKEKIFYIGYTDEHGDNLFSSDLYNFSEIDLLGIIKICIIEKRNKILGRKLLDVYRFVNQDNEKKAIDTLKIIGIEINGETNPRAPKNRNIQ